MSDKEPRRRKKRKDVQPHRKEDISTDDQFFTSTKADVKDSDPEVEEEIIMPSYQPSVFAKFVFVLLFSCLVLSMSFIFISLRGADRGSIDIFDAHQEEHEVAHDDTEAWSSSDSFQESISDILPGIGSILSFNDEHVEESEIVNLEETDETLNDKESSIDQTSESIDEISYMNVETSTVQSSTEDDLEDTDPFLENLVTSEMYQETAFESMTVEPEIVQVEEPKIIPQMKESIANFLERDPPDAEDESDSMTDFEPASENVIDYSDFTTQLPEPIPSPESEYKSVEDVQTTISSLSPSDELHLLVEEEDSEDEEEVTETPIPNIEEVLEAPSRSVEEILDEPSQNIEQDFPPYEKTRITNEEDFKIRHQLDGLDSILDKSPERALRKSEELLKSNKASPRLHYVKAQALDKLAEVQRSNKHLEEAIATYQEVMSLKGVPEELYLLAGKRAADRMRFRGFMGKSLQLLVEMANKFPQNVDLMNLVAVGYLLIGQNKEAKKVLNEVLKVAPKSGLAKVHLGFIMKTDDSNYKEAIKFLSEGIASREVGVIDGRFYFHLGDALHRIGKQDEAMKVYEDAVKEGLFLSAYQRSLYNVDGLAGIPWWNPQSTKYAPYFKILEKNWMEIRNEALSLTNEKNSVFLPESEGLQDTGDWKQFELFARGRKVAKNCLKAPYTCSLISQIPDAADCKRGQVKFSIMLPSTHIWAHTGPTNCRLRSHLGLVVPKGASIRVANETRVWEEGKVLLFDDSFEHEVWHNGTSSRMVLIVDFWHPELTAYHKRSLTPL